MSMELLGLSVKNNTIENKEDSTSQYGKALRAKNLGNMLTTFNIYDQYEPSHAEQELYRKLSDKIFIIENVGHDVVNWLAVRAGLAAHNKAAEYINTGFANK
jgi:hypothetical protein